jgi:predicted transcriptional regulator
MTKTESIYNKYILLGMMKSLSLKLDENVFKETEEITSVLKCTRNRYINDALTLYNKYNKREILKKKLLRESGMAKQDSMEILEIFEQLDDRNEAI